MRDSEFEIEAYRQLEGVTEATTPRRRDKAIKGKGENSSLPPLLFEREPTMRFSQLRSYDTLSLPFSALTIF